MNDGSIDRHKLGGHARAAALSPERRSQIARDAADARWNRPREDGHPAPAAATRRRGPRRIERATAAILEAIGEDPERPGLLETPARVARALRELTRGYSQNAGAVLKVFEDGAEHVDEMVTVGPIKFFSLCEHHMLPFHGDAWIGYVPAGRIVGLSKMARLVDVFARRLQVQERLTQQIAEAFAEHVNPKGVGVHLRARHLCMEMRGVERAGALTTTTAHRGVIFDKPEARAEFLGACRP